MFQNVAYRPTVYRTGGGTFKPKYNFETLKWAGTKIGKNFRKKGSNQKVLDGKIALLIWYF